MGKKKIVGYVPDALQFFEKVLENLLWPKEAKTLKVPRINLEWLEGVIKALPKKDREAIEKFWGLTGGMNFSKRVATNIRKDIAFTNMRNAATTSLNVLLIDMLAMKIDKGGMKISNVQAFKYLQAFVIFILNGPKLSFEDDPLKVNNDVSEEAVFSPNIMLREMCADTNRFRDHSINLRLLIDFLEFLDYKDWLVIKKSLGIELPKDCEEEEIEVLKTFSEIRKFKERIFPYGPWDVSSVLILGDPEGEIELDQFMEELNTICHDWSISKYKTEELNLQTVNELRRLDVFDIGGMKFTDLDEVRFLYLERNLI